MKLDIAVWGLLTLNGSGGNCIVIDTLMSVSSTTIELPRPYSLSQSECISNKYELEYSHLQVKSLSFRTVSTSRRTDRLYPVPHYLSCISFVGYARDIERIFSLHD